LQAHARMQEPHGKGRRKQCQRQHKTKTEDNGRLIFLFERVEEEFVPAIERDGGAEIRKKKK
jgi:hypothetical protein